MSKVTPIMKLASSNENVFRVTLNLDWKALGYDTYVGKVGKWTVFVIARYSAMYYLTINLPGTMNKAVKSDSLTKLMVFSRKVLKRWAEGCEQERNYENR